jgi:hypothetical protein
MLNSNTPTALYEHWQAKFSNHSFRTEKESYKTPCFDMYKVTGVFHSDVLALDTFW